MPTPGLRLGTDVLGAAPAQPLSSRARARALKRRDFDDMPMRLAPGISGVAEGEEIGPLMGLHPKPHFQFAPEEGSEGLSAPPEVRCRCLEDS